MSMIQHGGPDQISPAAPPPPQAVVVVFHLRLLPVQALPREVAQEVAGRRREL